METNFSINTPILQRQGSIKIKRVKLITFRDELAQLNLEIGQLLLLCPETACMKNTYCEDVIDFCKKIQLTTHKNYGNELIFAKMKEGAQIKTNTIKKLAREIYQIATMSDEICSVLCSKLEKELWDLKMMLHDIDDMYVTLFRKKILFNED